MNEAVHADKEEVSDRSLARTLAIAGVLLELPFLGQLFFFGDVFDWGWLFLLALVGPSLALAGLAMSVGRRDGIGVGVGALGLGGLVVPLLVVWALLAAFQQG